jgi:hypothetical protein
VQVAKGARGAAAMSLNNSKPQPTIFLSYSSQNRDWKDRFFGEETWWESVTSVAEFYDYQYKPHVGDRTLEEMTKLIESSKVFIPIISDSYINREGLVEHEFLIAVTVYSNRKDARLFYPILIDKAAEEWWHKKAHDVFKTSEWLRNLSPIRLASANLSDGKKITVALDARRLATHIKDGLEHLPSATEQIPIEIKDPATPDAILVLGDPTKPAAEYAVTHHAVVDARAALTAKLRDQNIALDSWNDGWLNSNSCPRKLQEPWPHIVRPVGLDEATAHAVTSDITARQLIFATRLDRKYQSAFKISLWLPRDISNDPRAETFIEASNKQASGRVDVTDNDWPSDGVRFSVSTVDELVGELSELLAPAGDVTQITVEPVDDLRVVQAGRNARQIVEDELRTCVIEGARQAAVTVQPLVRQFLNFQRLAGQIVEAKNGRTILVAHDLTEHVARSNADAHKLLGRKLRKLREAVEAAINQIKGTLLPITLAVTNFDNLHNDRLLDEEIAGRKWRILPGRLDQGKFVPVLDNYRKLVEEIATVLRPGVSP